MPQSQKMPQRMSFLIIAMAMFALPTLAAEQTVTLNVENMSCASCPMIVKGALKSIEGVRSADVSLPHKTAVVTFDDAMTNIAALTSSTTNAGFPSALKE